MADFQTPNEKSRQAGSRIFLKPQFEILLIGRWETIEMQLTGRKSQVVNLRAEAPEPLFVEVNPASLMVEPSGTVETRIRAVRRSTWSLYKGGDFNIRLYAWTEDGDQIEREIPVKATNRVPRLMMLGLAVLVVMSAVVYLLTHMQPPAPPIDTIRMTEAPTAIISPTGLPEVIVPPIQLSPTASLSPIPTATWLPTLTPLPTMTFTPSPTETIEQAAPTSVTPTAIQADSGNRCQEHVDLDGWVYVTLQPDETIGQFVPRMGRATLEAVLADNNLDYDRAKHLRPGDKFCAPATPTP